MEGLARFRGVGLDDPEMVVIEDAQRFDHVGGGDPTIADEKEVLAVGGVSRTGKVERSKIDTGGGLVEVDDDELVVHERATASGSFCLERLGQVLFQCGRADDADRPVGLGEFQALYAGIGYAVAEDAILFLELFDGVLNGAGCQIEEGEGE